LLKITGVPQDRALLVGVEFVSRPLAFPRSAAMAREAPKRAVMTRTRGGARQELPTI
jgi:hypothetical protein